MPRRPLFSRTAAIALLLSAVAFGVLPGEARAVEPSTDHDVVIVGAGAAGLYAAYELDGLGYDVLVLEATARHGGRIYSDTVGSMGIERGAEELYGSTNNFVFDDVKNLYGNGAQIRIYRENMAYTKPSETRREERKEAAKKARRANRRRY